MLPASAVLGLPRLLWERDARVLDLSSLFAALLGNAFGSSLMSGLVVFLLVMRPGC